MSLSRESDLYEDSETSVDSSPLANHDPATNDDEIKLIDDTIKAISRNMRKGDWAYLSKHPEVRAIIRVIVTGAIKEKPKNIFTFAADIFSARNYKEIGKQINKQMRWLSCQVKPGPWAPAEGILPFTESSSDESYNVKKTDCPVPIFEEDSSECDDFFTKPGVCPENFKPC